MCLACSFIGNPSVVFLEDPSVGLDTAFQKRFWENCMASDKNTMAIWYASDQYIPTQYFSGDEADIEQK